MSWKATAFILELCKYPDGEPLTRDEKLLLLALADHHNASSNEAWPSVSLLAQLSLMSERHARDILRKAERHGLISTEQGGGRGKKSSYRFIAMEKIPGTASLVYSNDGQEYPAPCLPGIDVNPAETRQKPGTAAFANKEELGTKNLTPSAIAETPNPIHAIVRTHIQKIYSDRFNLKCPWDPSEAKQLKTMIEANPSWDSATWVRLVNARYASDGVNGERPRTWIPQLARYAGGPLDQFGNPKTPVHHSEPKQKTANQIWKESLQ